MAYSYSLPDYGFAEPTGSPVDQLGKFEDILLAGKERGVVSSTPNSRAETYQIDKQRVRLQTVASRLWLLGYLPSKIPPEKIDNQLETIKKAVGRFQQDADLKRDYWVGDKTWYALDELVSFESSLSTDQWFTKGVLKLSVTKVVHRAIQLRLWSLGLFPKKPTIRFKKLTERDLKGFEKILRIFLIKKGAFSIDLSEEYIQLIFDQDLLTESIARRASPNNRSFLLHLSGDSKEQDLKLAQSFIVNCAKIELWLLGYEVAIDGKNNYQNMGNSNLSRAIAHFYYHFERKSKHAARSLAKAITPDLFTSIAQANRLPEGNEEEDASDLVTEEMTAPDKIRSAWSYIKSKGIRLWDGLKRIWRWVKKIGEKAVKFIEKNIFKAFFRYATKAFKIITKAIDAVVDSVRVYVTGDLLSRNLHFRFFKDFDTAIFVNNKILQEDIVHGLYRLKRQSKGFSIACRIIGYLFDIFKKLVTDYIGWVRILFSLVKSYKEIHLLYIDLKEIAKPNPAY